MVLTFLHAHQTCWGKTSQKEVVIADLIFDWFIYELITGSEVKYVVNFASELSEIVTETKYMEQLGFSIPELARNVALQVSVQIYIYCNERPWLKLWVRGDCSCAAPLSKIAQLLSPRDRSFNPRLECRQYTRVIR